MVQICIGDFFHGTTAVAAGATLGLQHFRRMCAMLPERAMLPGLETIVGLDMHDVEDATPSYIKATVLALHQAGRSFARVLTADEHKEIPSLKPLNICVTILNASEAVQECIHEVFARRNLAILCGSGIDNDLLNDATLLGTLDPKVLQTLEASCSFEEFQAADLLKNGEQISVTGWNNRLAELHRQRLLRRLQRGRTNRFIPLAIHIQIYGQVLPRK